MADILKGLPVRTEEDADLKVQVKVMDYADPDGVDKQMEVSEKLAHVRVHGEDPAGAKTQLKLSELGAPNGQGAYDASDNTKPGSAGLIAHDRAASPDETDQNERITGVTNGTVHALDVSMHQSDGSAISLSNPLPVVVEESFGTPIHDYNEAVDVAASAGTDTHTYSVPDGKTFLLKQVLADASSRFKLLLEIGDGAGSEVFAAKASRFHTEAGDNADIEFAEPITVVGTVNTTTVKITVTNRDEDDAQSIYTTIIGVQRDT